MPAFLVYIAESWFGKFVLQFLLGKLIEWVKATKANYDAKKAIEKEARDSVQKLKDAKTAQEVDDATDDALDGV